MTNNTIPHDHHHHHRLRPHHQGMDHLQALAVKPQMKKQARRRTHTSRPYQERLLNMAEARREIVTALKIHRATSTRQHQQKSTFQHHHEPPPPLRQPPFQQPQQQQEQEEQQQVQAVAFQNRSQSQAAVDDEASLAHTTTMTMSYAAASFYNPLCRSAAAHWIAAGSSYCAPPPILRLPCDLTPPEPELPPTAAAMVGLVELEHYQGDLERLVRSLPAQPLGLNLSFQGFGVAVDDGAKNDCEDLFGSLPLTQPSPTASYSNSPPAVETAATIHASGGHGSPSPPLSATDADNETLSVIDAPAAALVPVLLDGGTEMTEQQASTGGETQGVEWTADVAAWWSKIFESGQRAPPDVEDVSETAAGGLPAEWRWLCGDDDVGGSAEQRAVTGGVLATTMHVDDGDYHSCCYEGRRGDDGEDVTLPCMDGIGDGVWDGEWFSCS